MLNISVPWFLVSPGLRELKLFEKLHHTHTHTRFLRTLCQGQVLRAHWDELYNRILPFTFIEI